MPDATPPGVGVAVPAEGATYVEGDAVVPSYDCSDRGGSSLQTCSASAVMTDAPGPHTATVTATDGAGNTTTRTRHYTVLVGSAPDVSGRTRHGTAKETLVVVLTNRGAHPDALTWSVTGGARWRVRGPLTGTTRLLQPGESSVFRLRARPPGHGRPRTKVRIVAASTYTYRADSFTWRLRQAR